MLRSLDLFSGVGGITHALRGLATPVMYCEKDRECHVVMHKLQRQGRLPKAPIHDDITRLTPAGIPGKVDLIAAGFPCFPAGTLVNTNSGCVPIEQVTGEHLLLTHTGQYKPINNLQRKLLPAGQPMYTVCVQNNAAIRCTEEHPFYIRRGRGDPDFVEAKLLEVGDQAYLPSKRAWQPVRQIQVELTAADQWVYNFEVADDNSYCVENVAVHNCIGFSTSGKREGLDQAGSRLFYHVMRLAKDIRPPLMFFENVEAILGNDDITKIVSSIQKLGYDMYWVVLPAYTVGAPQKRSRWFCLCVRRGAGGLSLRPSETYARHNWKKEPAVRMVPATTPDVRRRMRMLGNGVVPDCVRAAFLSLWTGCVVPVPRLLAASSKGSPAIPLRVPQPRGELRDARHKSFAGVVNGKLSRIPVPPGLLSPPRLDLVLDPRAYKTSKASTQERSSGVLTKPKRIYMWSTIRAGNGAYGMNVLTNRGSHDLGSQLRFERRTPASQRDGLTNPEWAEWLQGLPRGWTSTA